VSSLYNLGADTTENNASNTPSIVFMGDCLAIDCISFPGKHAYRDATKQRIFLRAIVELQRNKTIAVVRVDLTPSEYRSSWMLVPTSEYTGSDNRGMKLYNNENLMSDSLKFIYIGMYFRQLFSYAKPFIPWEIEAYCFLWYPLLIYRFANR
jgi:hypothetical protein